MKKLPSSAFAAAVCGLLSACGPGAEKVAVGSRAFLLTETDVSAEAAVGFADQAGGAFAVGPAGTALRLRVDGSRGPLDSHPGNEKAVAGVRAVFPFGPHSGLVAAESGLYLASGGWMIAPPWTVAVPTAGLRATADDDQGVVWLGHEAGLFHVQNGEVAELKVSGASLGDVRAMAVFGGATGPALFVAHGGALSTVKREKDGFVVEAVEFFPDPEKLTHLVALGAGTANAPELYLVAEGTLSRYRDGELRRLELPGTVMDVLGQGRSLFVRVDGRLLSLEADGSFSEVSNLPAGELSLVAVEAAGGSLLRAGEKSFLLEAQRSPRVSGLDQNAVLTAVDLSLSAQLPSGAAASSVRYTFGGLAPITVIGAPFSPGGLSKEGLPEPLSLIELPAGPAELTVQAHYADGSEAVRTVPFTFSPKLQETVSFGADIVPLYVSRCIKCHDTGPGRVLSTYDKWRTESAVILAAIKDRRMPADGPLDPAAIEKIQRWVLGGMQP